MQFLWKQSLCYVFRLNWRVESDSPSAIAASCTWLDPGAKVRKQMVKRIGLEGRRSPVRSRTCVIRAEQQFRLGSSHRIAAPRPTRLHSFKRRVIMQACAVCVTDS